jgi:hypothetical protein
MGAALWELDRQGEAQPPPQNGTEKAASNGKAVEPDPIAGKQTTSATAPATASKRAEKKDQDENPAPPPVPRPRLLLNQLRSG